VYTRNLFIVRVPVPVHLYSKFEYGTWSHGTCHMVHGTCSFFLFSASCFMMLLQSPKPDAKYKCNAYNHVKINISPLIEETIRIFFATSHFAPFLVSTDGMFGFEARAFLKRLAKLLVEEWEKPYSIVRVSFMLE